MPPPIVDVVIPICGAPEATERCFESLVSTKTVSNHRLVLALDGPQCARIETLVAGLDDSADRVVVLRSPERRGFAGTINSALATRSATSDVVLLNSDTQVTSGWIEGLSRASRSQPNIATVTPLTNNGTICSVPIALEENLLPSGHDAESFACLVRSVSQNEYPEVPTAVGFCMYIRAAALESLDRMDEGYGLGYGEEVDYCLRLSALGFRHVADDATFVFHRGGASFGAGEGRLRRKGALRLRLRHPRFRTRLAEFLKRDPLAPIRARIVAELRRESGAGTSTGRGRRILHVVHGWPTNAPGGTESYAAWLAGRQVQEGHRVTVFTRNAPAHRPTGAVQCAFDRGVDVRFYTNHFDQRSPLRRNALHEARANHYLRDLVSSVQPELIHLHHLAGHGITLMGEVLRPGVPAVLQLQDWWLSCRRANLWHKDQYLCSGPSAARCSQCLPYTNAPPQGLWNRVLHTVRRALVSHWAPRFSVAVCGSEFLARTLSGQLGLQRGREFPVQVIPYGVPTETTPVFTAAAASGPLRPLRVGVIATAMPHKGLHLALEAFEGLSRDVVELHHWGQPASDPSYRERLEALAQSAPVTFHGPFPDSQRSEILSSFDVLLVPSVGLESFGLVVREAHAVGTPAMVSRLGALSEALPANQQSHETLSFDPDPESLRAAIERLIGTPGSISREREILLAPKSLSEHADEIWSLYEEQWSALS